MESHAFEVFSAIVSTGFLSFITLNLYPTFAKNGNWKRLFVLDFITLITPLLLVQTVLADYVIFFNASLVAICVYLGLKNTSVRKFKNRQLHHHSEVKNKNEECKLELKSESEENNAGLKKIGDDELRNNSGLKKDRFNSELRNRSGNNFGTELTDGRDGKGDAVVENKSEIEENSLYRDCITNQRATTNILSIIAILAVDFNIFPTRFRKTESFGFSLMDVGVGTYVITNAMVARETRGKTTPMKKNLIEVTILLILGLFRFFSMAAMGFTANVHEYGIHWNFFFTLAATKLISACVIASNKINNTETFIVKGFIVLITHQIALTLVLEDFVFSDFPRSNFFTANREGIVSILGYASLYLLQIALSSSKSNDSCKLATLSTITLILNIFFESSRCVANSTYCFMIINITAILHVIYYNLGDFMRRRYDFENLRQTTFVFEAINYNPLVFFMTSNLCTGFVNGVFTTTDFGTFASLFLLIVYLFVNCLIVAVMYVKKIKIKG